MLPAADQWMNKTKTEKQRLIHDFIDGKLDIDFIDIVKADHLGIVASLGNHFDYAIFGRDSIRVAKDLLSTHKELARRIILTLASLQGTKYDNISEEEPGKIHHEHRTKVFNNQSIPDSSAQILNTLQEVWGGKGTNVMTYYGSADATPLFVRLIHSYVLTYGPALLDKKYTDKDGSDRTIKDSLRSAVEWICNNVENSQWKLLEYRRKNPNGLANQVWKDSITAYLHTDGSLANFDGGISAIELQGYAYDALLAACEIFKDDVQVQYWKDLARDIQVSTVEKFWMDNDKYFAQGLDKDEQGNMRQIATLTSNPALLLRSQILKGVSEQKGINYAEFIVNMIMSAEFMSEGGVRCRAIRHKKFPSFPDYHGSFTTWPKETYEIAKGLNTHGYKDLADELDTKVLNLVAESGEFSEFYYVKDDGTVWHDGIEAVNYIRGKFGDQVEIPYPEAGQAWTISAVMAIVNFKKSTS